MTTKSLAAVLLLLVLVAGAPAPAADFGDARQESLRGDLRELRGRVERAPRATGYDLDRAERRLQWLRVENPRDPRVWHRQREMRILRQRADRAAWRPRLGSTTPRQSSPGAPLHAFRQPPPGDLRGERLPLGTGQRLILIQNGLRGARADLEAGQADQAGRRLSALGQELDALGAELGSAAAADPNLVAARAEIGRLRALSSE